MDVDSNAVSIMDSISIWLMSGLVQHDDIGLLRVHDFHNIVWSWILLIISIINSYILRESKQNRQIYGEKWFQELNRPRSV